MPTNPSSRPWTAEITTQGAHVKTAYSADGAGTAIGCFRKDEGISREEFVRDVNHLIGCVNAFGAIENPELAMITTVKVMRQALDVLKALPTKNEHQLRVYQSLLNNYEVLKRR